MINKFRHTRPWDVEAEPAPERKPLISAGEWGGLGWACAIGGIAWVSGAATISWLGMGYFTGVSLVFLIITIWASVRSRRGQP